MPLAGTGGDCLRLDERLMAAVTPIVPVCVPEIYTGDAEEYCTFRCTELPAGFGDNRAHHVRYLVQLHWFLPLKRRPHRRKAALRRALMETRGFTTPVITPGADEVGQHYVFEFEALEGGI